jgi:hypothetical protein
LIRNIQVLFNLASSIGFLIGDDHSQSALSCTSASCAAITRLLLVLVPQFAIPGSRTARNHERNARMTSPIRSGKTASTAPRAWTHETFEDCSQRTETHIWQQHVEQQLEAHPELKQNADSDQKLSTAENVFCEVDDTMMDMAASFNIGLRISCSNLLDKDVFSKSDP